MANDPEGLVTFTAGGTAYTAVFGFRAMKAVEAHYGLPFFKALQTAMPSLAPEDAGDPVKVAEAGASLRLTDVGALFQFALAKHHDLSEAEAEDLIDEIGFERTAEVIGQAVTAALSKQGGEEKGANPPKRRR